jgi:uncharacterized membrane protein YraQ (UPF0718 family)
LVADWASIVLAALPYIVGGSLAAHFSRRFLGRRFRRKHLAIALLAVLNPGCDCALNGFAGALARLQPALAGFALTLAAAASPVSLAVTYAAFGMHMTIARAAGALLAASLTSAAWSATIVVPTDNVVPTFMVGRPIDNVVPIFMVGRPISFVLADLADALRGVAYAATAAAAIKTLVPVALFAHIGPAGAALLGALLSPCSTADPLMAAAFMRNTHAQLAFMLAAQCLDVRQMLLVLRHFGRSRMIAAACCAACACALAAMYA